MNMIALNHVKYVVLSSSYSYSFKLKFVQKILACSASTYTNTFKFSDLQISVADDAQRQLKPDFENLQFGKKFSDHMFQVEWDEETGWKKPQICPLHNLNLHPACKVFHYAQELFEGMKAFNTVNNKVMMFRPNLNIDRLLRTAERASLPLFDKEEFLKCLKKLIAIDQNWVPNKEFHSLYIRPTFIGTEPCLGVTSAKQALLYVITSPVGPYYATGTRNPVSLYADPKYIRSWVGGVGDKKMGANYGPTIYVQKQAEKMGLQQVLWLYGDDHKLTEVGAMNIFVHLINKNGEKELVTPPLDGTILPGITRQTLLDLANKWREFKVSERVITMKEIIEALNSKRVLEIFGSGTACVICPVGSIVYMGNKLEIPVGNGPDALSDRFFNTLTDIQAGKIPSDWMFNVD